MSGLIQVTESAVTEPRVRPRYDELTSAQQAAIAARGNVLVVAGAGTGKTRTLVERCLACLVADQPPASLDEILMVTFTEAAAAEMRQRIRARLEEELERDPDNPALAGTDGPLRARHTSALSTAFASNWIRQHFYELELDPQLAVLAEEEARPAGRRNAATPAGRALRRAHGAAEAVQQLIQIQGGGWDKPIRALVLRLHHYAQTLPTRRAGWPAESPVRLVRAGHLAAMAARRPGGLPRSLAAAAGSPGRAK